MEYIYAALLLHKLGKPVNEESLKKVISATGAEVDEGKVKTLIASLHGIDIATELQNASAVAAAPATGSKGETAKKEEKKEEEKPSESAAGLSALFG
ncbi:50S ribosomal protein P1 [Candidatus Pacearchaeota archaeon]|nr:50S ribosomal protein P1 [Candidatus Pacearchaeota archaeon]